MKQRAARCWEPLIHTAVSASGRGQGRFPSSVGNDGDCARSRTWCRPSRGPDRAQQLVYRVGFHSQERRHPEKRALLDRLPPDKLVVRKRGGKTYYIYADPNMCRCAYVVSPEAYRALQSEGMPQTDDGSSGNQLLDEFAEADMPTQPGAPSFDDYVFGGMRDD